MIVYIITVLHAWLIFFAQQLSLQRHFALLIVWQKEAIIVITYNLYIVIYKIHSYLFFSSSLWVVLKAKKNNTCYIFEQKLDSIKTEIERR